MVSNRRKWYRLLYAVRTNKITKKKLWKRSRPYKKLDTEIKKEVIRTGNIPKDKDDFNADTLSEICKFD